MTARERFASNIKALRIRKGLTQGELADILGYSEKSVSKWERGASVPPIETVLEISKLSGMKVEALFCASERYYLAIDGGGTKTALLLADGEGRVIRRHNTTASNPVDLGFEESTAVLERGIREILGEIHTSEVIAFIGIAGGTSAGMKERLHGFFEGFGFAAFKNDSDIMNILESGLGQRDGIAMIMGTGICAFVRTGEKISRVSGWGYLIDEGGSGYNLGRDALSAYFTAQDGRGAETLLTEELEAMVEGGATGIMSFVYSGGKRAVASLAPAVFSALARGDETARCIFERNMREAAAVAEAAASRFPTGERVPLVLAGGLTAREITVTTLKSLLDESRFELIIPEREPIYGALSLAMKIEVKEELK